MSHIQLGFRVLTFTVYILVIKGVTLEFAKKQTCKEDVKVTSALNDIEGENQKFLFSGHLVFTIKVPELELVRVQRIIVRFPGVKGPVFSSLYNYNSASYFLRTAYGVYKLDGDNNLTFLTWAVIAEQMKNEYGIEKFDGKFRCSTMYKDNPFTLAYVDSSGKACQCTVVPRTMYAKSSCRMLEIENAIPNPNGVVVKDACEGLSIERVENQTFEFRFLLADRQKLRLWHDKNLVNSVSYIELFECSQTWVYILIFTLLAAAIVIILITGTVYFKVQKSAAENSQTTITRGLTSLKTTTSKTQKKLTKKK